MRHQFIAPWVPHSPPRAKRSKMIGPLRPNRIFHFSYNYVFAKNIGIDFGLGSFLVFVDVISISWALSPPLAPAGKAQQNDWTPSTKKEHHWNIIMFLLKTLESISAWVHSWLLSMRHQFLGPWVPHSPPRANDSRMIGPLRQKMDLPWSIGMFFLLNTLESISVWGNF